MSERILKALMQLFALVSNVDDVSNRSRVIVQLFLKQQLNQELVDEYLELYDEFLEVHHKISKRKEGVRKRTSLNSVKILRICTQINEELTQRQKVVVLIRIIEYIHSNNNITEQEIEFVETVADTFNIERKEFDRCMAFVKCTADTIPDSSQILIVDNKEVKQDAKNKHIHSEGLVGELAILNISSVNMFVLRYFGKEELYLNGQLVSTNQSSIFTQGSSIRSSKVAPIYYSDVISRFLASESKERVIYEVKGIDYQFKGGKYGLQKLNFTEESGRLIGIMGGSGAGKSTLLNVLNGINPPSSGDVLINNISIHFEKEKIEGVIGYISQDDLLIEELTVFQNLFYNAKLCFADYDDNKITELVNKTLNSLGLFEIGHLKVGSPLNKKISGGQRKRLNIALELIREPTVLFVDEPTSGLSSRDSENIMDLLKELALKGKLIFVVIHQPSSEIFKMFDMLLILDQGGYTIYYGNPVDAVIYFKKLVNHVKSDESECIECGNVNPEQIFNIIELKVLDEYGNLTDNRKISPKEWNNFYHEKLESKVEKVTDTDYEIPESTFKIPNLLKQFKVFITRDVLSKITNTQYLAINLLEAPLLSFILAYFIKFYVTDFSDLSSYNFHDNENMPVYMFMAVIVSLFIGLTVSAEEIIRDQKILKREAFLNLSKGSYLWSKISIMFVLSAIQALSYVIVGNLIMDVKGMYFSYWLVLFSTSCFANMLGLNISSSFNSAVTIYILIPFLVIPQLLFSGVIVKFEKLNPAVTSQTTVPIIGEVMASRWAFEALAVNQFINNKYEKQFYKNDKIEKNAFFKKNFWMPDMREAIGNVKKYLKKGENSDEIRNDLLLLQNEIKKENKNIRAVHFGYLDSLTTENISPNIINELSVYIEKLDRYYGKIYLNAIDTRDNIVRELTNTPEKKEEFKKIKSSYANENLTGLVTNKHEINKIIEVDNQLIQRMYPIYLDSEQLRAHFYAPRKKVFGRYMDTFWVNIVVLWLMSITLIITLYFDVFRKLMDGMEALSSRILSKI